MSIRKNPIVQQTSARLYGIRDETGDIKFKIGDKEISAHKCILGALSPKYERQFYGDFDDKDKKVIEVNELCVTAAAFSEFLQFFYLDEVKLTDENIEGVIFLAKESLVPEFYNECTRFLVEGLSIDNVCQSYRLAILHEYNDLMKSCENKIQMKLEDVFKAHGFISCDRTMLSNIFQLAPLSCKAADVFEACISWAKHFCAANNRIAENNEHLREVLGDTLYQIRFGTMTMEEFMSYYRPYKDLFTDEEREEIFCMIGKVTDFKPKLFVDQRYGANVSANAIRTWDEAASIECSRIFAEISAPKVLYKGVYKTSFSCTHRVLLGAVYFGTLFPTPRGSVQKCLMVNLKITEKDMNAVLNSEERILFIEPEQLTFRRDQQACFILQPPIPIKSYHFYEISVELQENLPLQGYEFRDQVVLDNETIVQFYDVDGPVTCLKLALKPNCPV